MASEDEDEEQKEQDVMSFLANPAERGKAYGRLKTAVSNSGNPSVLALYDNYTKSSVDRDAKMRQFLVDWVIDPSFGKAVLKNHTVIEQIEEAKNKEEVVSYSRLEVLEGVKGARELKDKLEKTVDKFGRPAYKYSRLLKLSGAGYSASVFLIRFHPPPEGPCSLGSGWVPGVPLGCDNNISNSHAL